MPKVTVACLHLMCNLQRCCFLLICISVPLEPLKYTFTQQNHTKNCYKLPFCTHKALKHNPLIVKVACLNLSCNLQTCYFLLNCIPEPLEPLKATFAQQNLKKNLIQAAILHSQSAKTQHAHCKSCLSTSNVQF